MRNRTTPEYITNLREGEIFVFGSNEAGVHGAGAAKMAMQWGAEMGQGFGEYGRTFAIPTKDKNIETLDLKEIAWYIKQFIDSAEREPKKMYLVTQIGCGFAGYTPEDIAPLFYDALKIENIYFPESFWKILSKYLSKNR